ncbi:hypothetical protein ACI1US_00924 [Leucobacter sp. BZR 635]
MSIAIYIVGIVTATLLIITAFEMLRRRKLKERHAMWWLLAGVLMLIVAVFPASVAWLASLLGVEVSTNLLFFIAVVALSLVSLQHSSELTLHENKLRVLTEEHAMLQQRVEQLEQRLAADQSQN